MNNNIYKVCAAAIFLLLLTGCSSKEKVNGELIKEYPISKNDVISKTNIVFDKNVSSDGNGSLVITTDHPAVANLYETGDIDVENAQLVYQAKVKTQDVDGNVYLEMWCQFKNKGEFFSRGFESSLTGTSGWTTLQTPFYLKKGENPDNVKLNIVIDGDGIVWVDDLKLLKIPLDSLENK